jgi:hypothetical protein
METAAIVSISATLGAMVFFAIAIAPAVFQALPADQAGIFLRRLFPRYYAALIIGVSAAGLLLLTKYPLYAGVCFLIAVSTLWIRQTLVPQINELRDKELAGDAIAGQQFAKWHRISVAINLLQLLALAFLLVWL